MSRVKLLKKAKMITVIHQNWGCVFSEEHQSLLTGMYNWETFLFGLNQKENNIYNIDNKTSANHQQKLCNHERKIRKGCESTFSKE